MPVFIAVAVLIFLMGLTQLYATFLLLRFLLGFADSGVFIISETWINQLAERKSRGRIIGLYATMLSAGFGAGPLLLSFTGVAGFMPFVIGAGLCIAAALVIFKFRAFMPDSSHEQASSSLSFIRLAPALLIAIATFAFWDGALLSLFPVYGLYFDFSTSFITLALSVCILGKTFLQIPIGWVADLTSRRGVLIFCAGAAALGAIALPQVIGSPMLFLSTLFFWGAAVGGIYTMAMSELGDRFTGAEIMAGNAAFAIAFGIGGMVGGPVTGAAMDAAGANGFTTTLALIFVFTSVFAAWRYAGSR
ncbi:MAG: MFS transporter [Hyphomicrobiales bacterium]